jgi:hypothetical protein
VSRKTDKGRLPDFVPLIKSTLKTPAWRAMSHGARSLYVALKVRYNTRLQNSVYMSARHGAEELGSSKDYVARWHHELQHYGFIQVIEGKEARLGSNGEGMAARVRLTEHWYAGRPPTRDFDRWEGTKFHYQKKKQKQKPVPQTGDTPSHKVGTPKPPETTENAQGCPINWGHKETPEPVLQTGDITSLTTPSPETGLGTASWTAPVLTELPWDESWQEIYREKFEPELREQAERLGYQVRRWGKIYSIIRPDGTQFGVKSIASLRLGLRKQRPALLLGRMRALLS